MTRVSGTQHWPTRQYCTQHLKQQMCADFSAAEVVFATIGGLRGAISLILAQMVVTEQGPEHKKGQRITAEARQAAPHLAGWSPWLASPALALVGDEAACHASAPCTADHGCLCRWCCGRLEWWC